MKYTKIFWQHDGKKSSCAQIHADHYSSTVEHILEMASELKKDFPDIKDKDIQVHKYGGQRIKGITFVEVFFYKEISMPDGYEEVKEVEYIL